jgi:penicillin-binding protein 1B
VLQTGLHLLRGRFAIIAGAIVAIAVTITYIKLGRYVEGRLAGDSADQGLMLYSAPGMVAVGDSTSAAEIAADLQSAGYTSDPNNATGTFALATDEITIRPGRNSYFREEPVQIRFGGGKVANITALKTNASVNDYALEPQPLVRVQEGEWQKRRPVRFQDIPRHLVDALLAAEDKHFFHHAGFDPFRIAKAAWVNFRSNRKEQGGSTLTMQLARNMFLDADKNWRRKLKELAIAETLELKLSKEEIFQNYVNQVYVGRRSTIAIHGFGQAAETYFAKNLRDVTLAEAATLAGLVQRPSYFNPVRHPDRAIARRNLVLNLMQQDGFITEQQRSHASAEQLRLAPRSNSTSDAPWFVDLAADDLHSRDGAPMNGRAYTTLDPMLQRAAAEAVRAGLVEVDRRVGKRKDGVMPQVALIALDPHTGEVKALVGGRDFGQSQVNHAVASRQPGSVFKPFVYAAALGSTAGSKTFTPASTLVDAPTTFHFEGAEYRPSNFGDRFYGTVTLRQALAHSMNVATVSLAEQVGYRRVLSLAREAGFDDNLRPTPALALGAYESTPLEIAGAYTIFANGGNYVEPTFVSEVRSSDARVLYRAQPETHGVLEPGVAFVMQDLLTEVLRSGTAAGLRSRGFDAPAAGKTGTSRDGWFAGYVSNLICVVWVGYDDGSDLDIEGAKSALPIWAEFMKRAGRRAAYREDLGTAPASVVSAALDLDTGLLAGPSCSNVRREFFVKGTEPKSTCNHDDATPVADTAALQTVSGAASFYGDRSQGAATSNGERFDNGRLTAAHPSLPFGSQMRVTNLANGRSVVVTVTDRGPTGSRIISVSRRAAEELDFVSAGTAQVRVELLAATVKASL